MAEGEIRRRKDGSTGDHWPSLRPTRWITSGRFDMGVVALEIEWNNKDPFFDRDLENFKRLHADRWGHQASGIIVTRGVRDYRTALTVGLVRRLRRRAPSVTSIEDLLGAQPQSDQAVSRPTTSGGFVAASPFRRPWSHQLCPGKCRPRRRPTGESWTTGLHRGVGKPMSSPAGWPAPRR